MTIVELLQDVSSGLAVLVGDETRRSHLEAINLALSDRSLPPNIADALRRAASVIESEFGIDPMRAAMGGRGEARAIALELSDLMPRDSPRYLHHGTVFGALKSIAVMGLKPGYAPVWRDNSLHRANSDDAVFFTLDWRSAVMWSQSAHIFGRGRKASLNRSPVIVRIGAGNLRIEADPVAGHPTCVKVRAEVPTSDAEVLIALDGGIPVWRPLQELVALRKPALDVVPDLRPKLSMFP